MTFLYRLIVYQFVIQFSDKTTQKMDRSALFYIYNIENVEYGNH